MLWLYLLAAVTVLVIALRRVVLRQKPLDDALYFSKVAVEHVHSGVAWVRLDGKLGSVNPSLAASVGALPEALIQLPWTKLFTQDEQPIVEETQRAMLLSGIATLDTWLQRADGRRRPVHLRIVAAHDHKLRLVGHHCMIHDAAATHSQQAPNAA
jgi:PAS domain S-box-containing protein